MKWDEFLRLPGLVGARLEVLEKDGTHHRGAIRGLTENKDTVLFHLNPLDRRDPRAERWVAEGPLSLIVMRDDASGLTENPDGSISLPHGPNYPELVAATISFAAPTTCAA
ncbi:MAG TPA: hypothetical protein VMC43_02205 [Candidatus Paceibacterota bacterium]|nr:hypothetical protein [Candidatus Paceibacterota bacterium]